MPPDTDETRRDVWIAMWRGLRCRCPRCGEAWLFHHYLEQVDRCPVCGEPLAGYKVGLFLPLIVVTLVMFVIAVIMLAMELAGHGNPLVYLYVLVPASVVVLLAILPSSKGALIGLFWAKDLSDVLDR